jgi:hypothetical protein
MSTDKPQLFGTQKDYAWNAWQAAFDAGTLLPDRDKFETWWTEFGLTIVWKSTREMMQAAWGKGVADRHEQGLAGFNAWWAEVAADARTPNA